MQDSIWGSDQWGNITTGLELIRKTVGDQHNAVAMSSPLLLKADGTKFGKSESGALWLDEALTSPYELYQYFLNTSDDDILTYLKMLTLLSKDDIEALMVEQSKAPELRVAQKRLAAEVVELVHGPIKLQNALNVTESLFSGEFSKLSLEELDMAKRGLESIETGDINILDALVDTKLAQSKREAREFVKNGAVMVNETKVTDFEFLITKQQAYFDKYVIIKRGKKKVRIGYHPLGGTMDIILYNPLSRNGKSKETVNQLKEKLVSLGNDVSVQSIF